MCGGGFVVCSVCLCVLSVYVCVCVRLSVCNTPLRLKWPRNENKNGRSKRIPFFCNQTDEDDCRRTHICAGISGGGGSAGQTKGRVPSRLILLSTAGGKTEPSSTKTGKNKKKEIQSERAAVFCWRGRASILFTSQTGCPPPPPLSLSL